MAACGTAVVMTSIKQIVKGVELRRGRRGKGGQGRLLLLLLLLLLPLLCLAHEALDVDACPSVCLA